MLYQSMEWEVVGQWSPQQTWTGERPQAPWHGGTDLSLVSLSGALPAFSFLEADSLWQHFAAFGVSATHGAS